MADALASMLERAKRVYTLPWNDPSSAATYAQTTGVPGPPGTAESSTALKPSDVQNKVGEGIESIKAPESTFDLPDTGWMDNINTSLPPGAQYGAYADANYGDAQSSGAIGGGFTGKYTGGYGPGAYGFDANKVKTGQEWMKGKGNKFGFQPEMWAALQRAFGAMKASGVGVPGITDGFRSYALQVDTKRRKGNLAATPGRSIHGLGYAADLDLSGAQLKWLKANGGKYGLINLPSESWHWQLNPKLATTIKSWTGKGYTGSKQTTAGQPVPKTGKWLYEPDASYFGGPDELQGVAHPKYNALGGTKYLNAKNIMYVAHRDLPLGTKIRINYKGKVVDAYVLDRGPAKWTKRSLDLGYTVKRALGFGSTGPVNWQVIG